MEHSNLDIKMNANDQFERRRRPAKKVTKVIRTGGPNPAIRVGEPAAKRMPTLPNEQGGMTRATSPSRPKRRY